MIYLNQLLLNNLQIEYGITEVCTRALYNLVFKKMLPVEAAFFVVG
jgi:hypothetical protein